MLSESPATTPEPAPQLVQTPRGLALARGNLELLVDFSQDAERLKPHNVAREYVVRAAKIKGNAAPTCVDATCGLAQDAMLLAAAGFEVTAYEKNPTIFALVTDALSRAQLLDGPAAEAASRITLIQGDSIAALAQEAFAPDVVYLDPMFPARKKSAAVKKRFQLLHGLEAPCQNEADLLEAARAAAQVKVVVKRPPKAAPLAGVVPSYSLKGKAIRFDVYVR